MEKSQETIVFSADSELGLNSALRDFVRGWRLHRIWTTFAWDEIEHRYRRSALGLTWIAVSYSVFIFGISLFFGGFASMSTSDFVAYVAFGFASFTFFVAQLTDGCAVFTGAASWIKSTPLPYSIYVYKSLARSLFVFMIQFAMGICIALLFFNWQPSPTNLLVVPALFFAVLNGAWLQFVMGLMAARWRDIEHLTATVQRLLFFTTPILWVYEERGPTIQKIADLNPLTHFIEIFRDPMMGQLPSTKSFIVVLGITIFGWVAAIVLAAGMKRRLPFWV